LFFFLLYILRNRDEIKQQNLNLFFSILFVALSLTLSSHLYENDRNFGMIHMPFEETDTKDSGNSLSNVSSLDNDFARMQFESSSSKLIAI
jgi:hypothetical protein